MRSYYHIDGIHCGGCANAIERKLFLLGVDRADLDFSTFTLKVDYQSPNISVDNVMNAILSLGYTPIYLGDDTTIDSL